ncbi:hypothetical protein [Virgisporangium aurantiacum]|uniref:hypothetical protein n=1 Tax=Virgisporangium aurantiacum TaxID=175570 RepID=UPI00194DF83B|nr:hypothetical protein [Virgisporangium aurantiacum]
MQDSFGLLIPGGWRVAAFGGAAGSEQVEPEDGEQPTSVQQPVEVEVERREEPGLR